MAKKIISILLLIILLPILLVNSVILINSVINPDEVPSFFGWKPFIVLSGSMESEIFAGDIAVVRETDEFKKNDIIAFKTEDNIVITHRIVDVVLEDGLNKYVTKGDNNNTEDRGYVYEEDIEGVFVFKISRLGNVAMFIQTPVGMISCLSIPILILIVLQYIDNIKANKYVANRINKEKDLEAEIERLKKQNEELSKK